MSMATIETHDLCTMFPEMGVDEYAALVEDVRANGLVDPIVTFEGKILDGRHRHRACVEAGVDPRFEEWNGQGGSALAFVLSRNTHRRQLSAGQRAAMALEVKDRIEVYTKARRNSTLKKGDGQLDPVMGNLSIVGTARAAAAKMANASESYVKDLQTVRHERPDLFAEVKAGRLTIAEAKTRLDGDDLTDEEWLATLPLSSLLTNHVCLKIFQQDAKFWRKMRPMMEDLRAFQRKTRKELDAMFPDLDGSKTFLETRIAQATGVPHPKEWIKCPPTFEGGCDGEGYIGSLGQCPKCRTFGYLPSHDYALDRQR